jgi:4,5-DOPA dioxygenase extradiol
MSQPMPALFLGHGSPMNAIEANRYAPVWSQLGRQLPRPRAVLCVSAHWYTNGTGVTAMPSPRALFDCRYPAPGDPQLAARVQQLLQPTAVMADQQWGLDHGAWCVLKFMYPEANVPVVQLSLDGSLSLTQHYQLATRLAPLRDAGVLILGSGNVVHNLRRMQRTADAPAFGWATAFESRVRDAIARHDHAALQDLPASGEAAQLSVPTPEHYLPLLYVLAVQRPDETADFPVDGIDLGSISMLSVLVGAAPNA